jgi:hypothetical protein
VLSIWLNLQKWKFHAFECKWKQEKVKKPVAFAKAYPNASFTVINQDNYLDWLHNNP